MTIERTALATLFADCQQDSSLKEQFINEPKEVLSERGIDVPDQMLVKVIENTDTTMTITLPKSPYGSTDLTNEEMYTAAAGAGCYTCVGHGCDPQYTASA